jgi:hypothetical protein
MEGCGEPAGWTCVGQSIEALVAETQMPAVAGI